MKFALMSVFVEDQDKALDFYTNVLGFVEKQNFSVGEFKWLTVVSPEGPDDMELLLEPNDNPLSKTFQQGLYEQGITAASFGVDDIQQEYERLQGHGVAFKTPPTEMPGVWIAAFDDTCGNLIQIFQTA